MVAPDRHSRSVAVSNSTFPRTSESDSLGCALIESDGRLVSVTHSFAEMLGCRVPPLFGQSINDLLRRVERTQPGGLLIEGVEIPVAVLKTGRRLRWSIHKTAPGAALGGYYIGLLEDETTVGPRRQHTQQDHLAVLGQLTAGVAHEIAGTLSIIADSAELLLEEARVNRASRESLLLMRDEAHRLGKLLGDILCFARDVPLRISPHDCTEVVSSVVELCNRRRNGKNISLRVETEPALPPVAADADRLHQVFFNLIKNASDASPDFGEVLIQVRRGRLEHDKPAIEVVIRDHGTGIDRADLNRVFEPFFSTKRAGEGTGLGLAIAQRIVSAHGGELHLTSELGQGTAASILLPVFNGNGSGNHPSYLSESDLF